MARTKYSLMQQLSGLDTLVIMNDENGTVQLQVLIQRGTQDGPSLYSEQLNVSAFDLENQRIELTPLSSPGPLLETHMAGGATAHAFYKVNASYDHVRSVELGLNSDKGVFALDQSEPSGGKGVGRK